MKWLFKYIQVAIVKNDNVKALNIHLRPSYIFSFKNFNKQSIRYKLYPKSYKYQHIQQKIYRYHNPSHNIGYFCCILKIGKKAANFTIENI